MLCGRAPTTTANQHHLRLYDSNRRRRRHRRHRRRYKLTSRLENHVVQLREGRKSSSVFFTDMSEYMLGWVHVCAIEFGCFQFVYAIKVRMVFCSSNSFSSRIQWTLNAEKLKDKRQKQRKIPRKTTNSAKQKQH